MRKLLITNARVINESEICDADVLIKGERIDKIAGSITPDADAQILDANGKYLIPGMIDDPACTAGMLSSDKPAIGPDAISLISFDILPSSTA